MGDTLNPATDRVPASTRFGPELARPLKRYKAGRNITAAESEPAEWNACALAGKHEWVEFVVKPAAGVTGYTVAWGRWLYAARGDVAVVDEWLEVGRATYEGTADILFRTQGDPVGLWLVAIGAGSVTPGSEFFYYFRPANGS